MKSTAKVRPKGSKNGLAHPPVRPARGYRRTQIRRRPPLPPAGVLASPAPARRPKPLDPRLTRLTNLADQLYTDKDALAEYQRVFARLGIAADPKGEYLESLDKVDSILGIGSVLALAGDRELAKLLVERIISPMVLLALLIALRHTDLVADAKIWPSFQSKHGRFSELNEEISNLWRDITAWGEKSKRGPKIVSVETRLALVLANHLESLRVGPVSPLSEHSRYLQRRLNRLGPLCKDNSSQWWSVASWCFGRLFTKDFDKMPCFSPRFKSVIYKDLTESKKRVAVRTDIKRAMRQAFHTIAPVTIEPAGGIGRLQSELNFHPPPPV